MTGPPEPDPTAPQDPDASAGTRRVPPPQSPPPQGAWPPPPPDAAWPPPQGAWPPPQGAWPPSPHDDRPPPQWPPPQWPPPQWPPPTDGDSALGGWAPEPAHHPLYATSPIPDGSGGRFLDTPGAPPANRRAAWTWILIALIGFVVGQIVGTIFVSVAAATSGNFHMLQKYATMASPPEWYIGTSLVGLWVGFFGAPWLASRVRGTGRLISDFGLRFEWSDLLGIPIGIGGQFVLDALYAPFISNHVIKNFTGPAHKLVGSSHGWGFAVIAILTVCGAPFFEELLFRGLVFRALARLFTPAAPGPTVRRAWGVAAAVVVDGVLFGLAHWELAQFAGLAVFGMALALVSYRTGRLGMNMVAHASFNLVAVIAVLGSSGVVHF